MRITKSSSRLPQFQNEGDSMTLAALLKELKGIDPDTADDIGESSI